MRCVMAGSFVRGATGAGLVHGLRQSGWIVDEVEMLRFFRHGTTTAQRVAERLLRRANKEAFNRAIISSLDTNDAQLFLSIKGSFVSTDTLREARRRGVRSVLFYPDVEYEQVGIEETLDLYDFIFTTKSFHREFLDRLVGPDRWAFIDHGYVPDCHRAISAPSLKDEFKRDILFVGTHSSYKAQWLEHVARSHPSASLLIVGNQWREACRDTPLAPFVLGSPVEGDFYADLIGSSRINIALHHGPVLTPGWEDRVSTRSFEIPACGGFMLHIDNDEIRGLYDVPREIDVFASTDELAGKIGYYLERPEERQRIAAAGYRRAVPAYSLDARAAKIEAVICERLFGETAHRPNG